MTNINTLLGSKIRELRETSGHTQDEFANLCNISRAYYGRIERGEHSVTIDTCYLIAKTLGITLYDLFKNIESKKI